MVSLVQKSRDKGASVNIETTKKGYDIAISVKNKPVAVISFSKKGKITKEVILKKGFYAKELAVDVFKKRILKE